MDILIVDARCLIDGRIIRMNVGITGEKITFIGKTVPAARQQVEARGYYLFPGFIDAHSHSDLYSLRGKRAVAKISQGFTCEVVGNCGLGVFPVRAGHLADEYFSSLTGIFGQQKVNWRSFSGYCRAAAGRVPVNLRMFSSYATLRKFIAGPTARPLPRNVMARIKKQLRRELDQGSGGLSFGMIYPPNCFATDKEIKEIIGTVAEYPGRVVACHLWNEGDEVLSGLKRFLHLARDNSVKVEISHLKAYGRHNWQKMEKLLQLIDAARVQQPVEFDLYPYLAGSTMATTLLPPWTQTAGSAVLLTNLADRDYVKRICNYFSNPDPEWENYYRLVGSRNIRFINLRHYTKFDGWTLHDIAKQYGRDEITTICDIIREEKARPAMLMFAMTEKNLLTAYCHPAAKVGSDGLHGAAMHPRTFGTAAEFIDLVWRRKKRLTLPQAVAKLTDGYEFFNIRQRGRIAKGYYADLVLLDLPRYRAAATYEAPQQLCRGVEKVLINGKIAFSKGKVRILAGKVLRA